MKEKIFSAIIIIIAIGAIVYKLNFSDETSEKANQNNIQTGENTVTAENNVTENLAIGSYSVNTNMNSNEIVVLTEENFDEEVLKSDKTVIVDFYADWCDPCKALAPILEEIAKENEDIKVCKLNVDYEQKLAIEYGAQYLPTLLIFKDGEIDNKIIGLQQKSYILEKCK